jgi:hypothetical protein
VEDVAEDVRPHHSAVVVLPQDVAPFDELHDVGAAILLAGIGVA